jgi:GNAT superfamily N-acetyltransferase
MTPVLIRARTDADVDACVEVMRRTHEVDGYPRYWPAKPDRFLQAKQETDAFVAVTREGGPPGEGERVVGQVALHDAAGEPVEALACAATGLDPGGLAVLARLLVDPDVRGRGVGRALVRQAVARAHETGRRPVLDVLRETPGPIALYESEGWERLGPTTLDLAALGYGDVPPLRLWVYLGPPVPASSPTG